MGKPEYSSCEQMEGETLRRHFGWVTPDFYSGQVTPDGYMGWVTPDVYMGWVTPGLQKKRSYIIMYDLLKQDGVFPMNSEIGLRKCEKTFTLYSIHVLKVFWCPQTALWDE